MSLIEWGNFTNQDEFDRVVEGFFVKEYADEDDETYAVNGRGGDRGIDIHIRHNGKFIIAQLKFFREGFSGGFREVRRRQIRESLKSALTHRPDEWWLVVPTTLTPPERLFVRSLQDKRPRRSGNPAEVGGPRIRAFDRSKLDDLASKHPDLVTYYKRDEFRDLAAVYNQEKAILVNQRDVIDRVAALVEKAETLDPDWKLDVFSDRGVAGTILVAKHPFAAKRSPISICLTTSFTSNQSDLRAKFERAMTYGSPDRIHLPAAVVTSFEVQGPAFIAYKATNVDITWVPGESTAAGTPLLLSFRDSADLDVSSFTGKVTWAGRAALGMSIHAQFYDAISLRFELPDDPARPASVQTNFDLGGCDPFDVVRAVRLLEELDSGSTVALTLDGNECGRLLPKKGKSDGIFGPHRENIMFHKSVAEDLAAVQRHTSRYFGYPNEVELVDRVFLRGIRLLIDGCCIVMPDTRELNQVCNGEHEDSLRLLLEHHEHTITGTIDNLHFELFGYRISVGTAQMYAPRVEIVGADELLAALDAGTVAGRQLTVRASDDASFWIYLPGTLKAGPTDPIRPVSLGLAEWPDAPDVLRAMRSQA